MTPSQAQLHDAFMKSVWSDEPNAPDYETFHDAAAVAGIMGAKPTGKSSSQSVEWLFPDGSVSWIITDTDGTGVGIGEDNLP